MKNAGLHRRRCLLAAVLLMVLTACNAPAQKAESEVAAPSSEVTLLASADEETEAEAVKDVSSKKQDALTLTEEPIVQDDPIEIYVSGLKDEVLVGQLFYLDPATYQRTEIQAGGLIFFGSDMDSWEGTALQIKNFQAAASIPLFVGIDEEGGIVTRISGEGSIGGTRVENSWDLAHSDDPEAVTSASKTIAQELESLGFNMNFAPVADINSNPDNPIIGKRAFSDDPYATADFVMKALQGYETSKVIPCVKHFPGHGDTNEDSHDGLAFIEGNIESLRQRELIPFSTAIDGGVSVVMVGHIVLADSKMAYPASMSVEVIDGILRQELGFEGLVISDALNMGGITDHMSSEEAVEKGLSAGLNMFLLPDEPELAYSWLLNAVRSEEDMRKKVVSSVYRIIKLKIDAGILTLE